MKAEWLSRHCFGKAPYVVVLNRPSAQFYPDCALCGFTQTVIRYEIVTAPSDLRDVQRTA